MLNKHGESLLELGCLFTYGVYGDKIAKGLGITYKIANYTSPAREPSGILTLLIYSIKNHKTRGG